MFATHGLPEIIVTDNGTAFTSHEFQEFTPKNGICHIKTTLYYPASNGLAESVVQTFKEGLKKLKEGPVETKLASFLFQYRLTPHSTTGKSPAELLWEDNLGHIWINLLQIYRPKNSRNNRNNNAKY